MRKTVNVFRVLIILMMILLTSGRVCRAAESGGTSIANAPQITSSGTEIAVPPENGKLRRW